MARLEDLTRGTTPRGILPDSIVTVVDVQQKLRELEAMLYCTLERLGLETEATGRKPADQQIVLLNREVLDAPIR